MSFLKQARETIGSENLFLLGAVVVVFAGFSLATPLFLTASNFGSMAFQLPVLGLLTLAMMVPILSGGLNLAIIFQANISGLALAAVLIHFGGPEAGYGAFALGILAALIVGA
ncbi:ABC transporter permease, partial [bacterium]|nr:ABC transporter permease [bacterium]